MDYEKIKEIIGDMEKSKLTELNLEFPDGTKIEMKKDNQTIVKTKAIELESDKNTEERIVEKTDENKEEGNIITAPMVGNFYLRPDPNSDPFVDVGKQVKKGDIVCIIEAMKLMNEIECEFNGKVVEILAEDGKPVEYGTPLFRIV